MVGGGQAAGSTSLWEHKEDSGTADIKTILDTVTHGYTFPSNFRNKITSFTFPTLRVDYFTLGPLA